MKKAGVDAETIAIVLRKMREAETTEREVHLSEQINQQAKMKGQRKQGLGPVE